MIFHGIPGLAKPAPTSLLMKHVNMGHKSNVCLWAETPWDCRNNFHQLRQSNLQDFMQLCLFVSTAKILKISVHNHFFGNPNRICNLSKVQTLSIKKRLNWKKTCGKTSLKAGHAPQPDLRNHGLACIFITFLIQLQIHKHLRGLRMQVMKVPKAFVTPECMHMDLPMNCEGGYL